MSDIADEVKQLLADHLGVDRETVTDEAHILDDLGADSLDTVEIVMSIEEEFSIEVSDTDAEGIKTVADLIALVRRHKDTPVAVN